MFPFFGYTCRRSMMSLVVILCLAKELRKYLIIFILSGNAGVKIFPSHPLLHLTLVLKSPSQGVSVGPCSFAMCFPNH